MLKKSPTERNLEAYLAFTALRIEKMSQNLIFKPLALSRTSFNILVILSNLGSQSPGEIAELLGTGRSNISQRFNLLEKKSLVEKDFSGQLKDKRFLLFKITKLGKLKLEEASNYYHKHSLNIERLFNQQDLGNFLKFIKKINQELDKIEGLSEIKKK